jgi:hypothetical protein
MNRAAYMAAWRRRRAEVVGGRILHGRIVTTPYKFDTGPAPHGTARRNGYGRAGGCKCEECNAAYAAYRRDLRRAAS